ncbi:MAG: Spy/CpxP family protein refolding chaperone [Phycisphaerae bacterium]|nr:Spy/CpxP family protein refolding chaperone [Phycisphaerae bacterium]
MNKAIWTMGGILTAVLATGLLAGYATNQATEQAAGPLAADELGLPPAATNGDRPHGRMLRAIGRHVLGLPDEINLTADQKQQIGKVLKGHKAEIIPVFKQLRDDHRKLQSAVRAEPTDEKAIRSAAEHLGKDIGDAAVLRAKIRKEVLPILTDEQKAKLEKFRANVQGSVDKALDEAAAKE